MFVGKHRISSKYPTNTSHLHHLRKGKSTMDSQARLFNKAFGYYITLEDTLSMFINSNHNCILVTVYGLKEIDHIKNLVHKYNSNALRRNGAAEIQLSCAQEPIIKPKKRKHTTKRKTSPVYLVKLSKYYKKN